MLCRKIYIQNLTINLQGQQNMQHLFRITLCFISVQRNTCIYRNQWKTNSVAKFILKVWTDTKDIYIKLFIISNPLQSYDQGCSKTQKPLHLKIFSPSHQCSPSIIFVPAPLCYLYSQNCQNLSLIIAFVATLHRLLIIITPSQIPHPKIGNSSFNKLLIVPLTPLELMKD